MEAGEIRKWEYCLALNHYLALSSCVCFGPPRETAEAEGSELTLL